ncbi:MAG: 50S ribosomal protein L44e [Promethearchaeota archaeon]
MKHPREINRYCPKCGRHSAHTVSIYKKSKERSLAQGRRRFNRKLKGYRGYPRPVFHKNAKVNKKFLPILTCKECGRKQTKPALRLKKFELV